jgi:peptide/nickel transport system substrate-binding protein
MTSNALIARTRSRMKGGMLAFSLLVIFGMVLAACGGSSGTSNSANSGKKTTLTVGAHVGGDFTQALSPYNPSPNEGIQGLVYEPLYYVNKLDGSETPLLASSYTWSSDHKQLTFTLRPNVKWSDVQPFSSDDVVFTFNMLKQYPAADLNALWTYFSSVTSPDANTVTITFSKPYVPLFWYIGGQTWIVPKHIFSTAGDPTKFANEKPVGTGPFTFKKFSPQVLVYAKNPSYWQADKVKVEQVQYPSVKDNTTLQLKIAKGEIDWGGFFAPDLDNTFVAKDPAHNHYWMAPTDMFTIYVNLTKAHFNQLAFRQAVSLALDRTQLSKQAESGYVDPASTTGLILPNQNKFLDPALTNTVQASPDKAKATQLLQSAGYTKGADGILADKSGKKLSFKLDVVSGWTDWETMCQIIKQNLKDVGIDITINEMQDTAYFQARNNGDYDMLIGGLFGGPSPFYLYNTHLNSANLSPKGYNWGKWHDSATDKLLQQYASSTDENVQKQAIAGLEKIYTEQLPNIPLVNAASWYEYTTKNFTGFPDKDHPFAVGAAYAAPDNEIVVTHLSPA